jgi:APA family basic amino acid/polyamine antiporter
MIVVSLVIGMGIFRTPANVAAASPTTLIFFIAWIAGGLVALCGALTYAEIGSRFAGNRRILYKFFLMLIILPLLSPSTASFLFSNAASAAAIALGGSEYITGVIIPGASDAGYIQNYSYRRCACGYCTILYCEYAGTPDELLKRRVFLNVH